MSRSMHISHMMFKVRLFVFSCAGVAALFLCESVHVVQEIPESFEDRAVDEGMIKPWY